MMRKDIIAVVSLAFLAQLLCHVNAFQVVPTTTNVISSTRATLAPTTVLFDSTTAIDDETKKSSPPSISSGIDQTILSKLLSEDSTQTKLATEQVKEYNTLIESLPTPPQNLDVNGGWKLLATISPEAELGDNVDFFDIKSWSNYINGTGPSPFQSLITGSSRVNGLTQYLTKDYFDNIITFQFGPIQGKLILKASLEDIENNKRTFRFERGFFIVDTVWESAITIPYPVPFKLLGDRAIGSLETIGYDKSTGIRAAIGNKGTKFIFQREGEQPQEISDQIVAAYETYTQLIEHDTKEEEQEKNVGLTKRPVIICPAQFAGKSGDYTALAEKLRQRGHPVYLARLSVLDWLSIIKSAFTKAYFEGTLEPSKTLPFYMNAINEAVSRIDTDKEFSILSHSIGGWVARAWLGEVASEDVRKRCVKYVSLGTPHLAPPEESIVAKVDQTRGLLNYINKLWPGAHFDDIEYTCIASKAVSGKIELELNSLLAYASYFALSGQGDVEGDGITPVKAALLDGANEIVLDDIYHADFLPNPIGIRNTKLLGCKWYADQIDEWINAL